MISRFQTAFLDLTSDLPPLLPPSVQNIITDSPLYRHNTARVTLFALGTGVAIYKLFSWTKALIGSIPYPRNLVNRYGKGSWAVITGATEGIGRAFAFELANRGFNVVLVARNEEKLKKVKQDVHLKHPGVQIRIIVADFVHSYEEGFAEKIYAQVSDVDVSLLVNNAGVYLADYYRKYKMADIRNLILTNSLAHALIIRAFLPYFHDRKTRSAIINITSVAAECPKPFEQVYSASKTFHDYLSEGLVYEEPNIDIISVKPGEVSTNMNNYIGANINTITAEECVNTALKHVGRTTGTIGHIKHRLDYFVMEMIPEALRLRYYKWRFDIKE